MINIDGSVLLLRAEPQIIGLDASALIIVAIIIILVFALNRLFFRPVLAVMEERERRIAGPQEEAKSILADHGRQMASLQDTIARARRESNAFKAEIRDAARAESEGVVGEASSQAREHLELELKSLDEQKARARQELTTQVQSLAARIAGHFLR